MESAVCRKKVTNVVVHDANPMLMFYMPPRIKIHYFPKLHVNRGGTQFQGFKPLATQHKKDQGWDGDDKLVCRLRLAPGPFFALCC